MQKLPCEPEFIRKLFLSTDVLQSMGIHDVLRLSKQELIHPPPSSDKGILTNLS